MEGVSAEDEKALAFLDRFRARVAVKRDCIVMLTSPTLLVSPTREIARGEDWVDGG